MYTKKEVYTSKRTCIIPFNSGPITRRHTSEVQGFNFEKSGEGRETPLGSCATTDLSIA